MERSISRPIAGWMRKENLNILSVFEAILATRSVSKASEKLGISQPSLSYTLARMREIFDDPMFIRVGNEMQPTSRALSIAGPVKEVLQIVDREIFRPQVFDPATSMQTFTLCMTDVAETSFMPKIIAAVHSAAPQVRLKTITPISEKVEKGLESGAVDLAIGYFPDVIAPSLLTTQLIRSGGFVCIAAADNPHLTDGGLTLDAFTRAPHIAIRTEGRSQEVIEQTMESLAISRNIVLTIPQYFGLMSLIPQTDLISVVPIALAQAFAGQQGIQVLPLPFESPGVDVVLIWHLRFQKDPANRWLRDLVLSCHRGP